MTSEIEDDQCGWPFCKESTEVYEYCMSHAPLDVCETFLRENGDDLPSMKKTVLEHMIEKKEDGNFVVDGIR